MTQIGCPAHARTKVAIGENGLTYCLKCPLPSSKVLPNQSQYLKVETVQVGPIDVSKPLPKRFQATKEISDMAAKRGKGGRFVKKVEVSGRGRPTSHHDEVVQKFILAKTKKDESIASSVLLRMFRESGKGCSTRRFFAIRAAM